jgi:hypothetical protein
MHARREHGYSLVALISRHSLAFCDIHYPIGASSFCSASAVALLLLLLRYGASILYFVVVPLVLKGRLWLSDNY